MGVYTIQQPQLQQLLERAVSEGEVHLKAADGQLFVLKPVLEKITSPLDIPSLNLSWSAQEIVDVVRETREYIHTGF